MNVLAIYNESGDVVFTKEDAHVGEFEAKIVEIPDGKLLIGINPHTDEPIFEDIPKSETATLREEVAGLSQQLLDVYEMVLFGGM